MKLNALQKRTLRLEQLENRELLSATTWNDAAQADAALAAEMVATLNENAPIDLTAAFSAAEIETTAEVESTIWRVTSLEDGAEGSLRWAVANAQDGDSIRFDPALSDDGTCVEIKLTQGEIVIDKDITIDGYGLYRFDELEGLIYDKDLTGVKIDAGFNSRIFNIVVGADVKIVGVHMTNGSVRGDWTPDQKLPHENDGIHDAEHDPEHHGGTLHVPAGAKLSLSMCVVSNGMAIMGGGAAAVSGEFHAADTIFEGCDGGADHGGAIRIFNGHVEVVDCYFRDNVILPWGDGSTSGGGGAVAASGGSFRSFNTSYSGNSAWFGGAIHVNGGKVLLSNNLIVENGGAGDTKTHVGCYNGGGVDCDSGTLTIVNTTIANNISCENGAGLYINANSSDAVANRPNVNIYNSIIANNESLTYGWGGSEQANAKPSKGTANNLDVDHADLVTINGYYTLTDLSGWDNGRNGKGENIIVLADSDKLFKGEVSDGENVFYSYDLGPDSPAANVGSNEYSSIFRYDETAENWVRTDEKIKCDFIRYQRVWNGTVDLGAFERDSQPYYEAILRPENVRFSDYNRDAKTVVVSWDDKSYNELGFRVEISTDGKNWSWVAQTAENVASTTLSGIEPNKTYYVRVRAEIELSNVSEWSDVADFTALFYTLDEPVVSANATSSTEIAFNVGEVENAVGYVYEYSANPDFSNATRGELATSGMLTISGLDPYTTYYFRAYAIGSGFYLDSPWSSTFAKTERAVLPAPTPSVALTEEKTTLELAFKAVDNAVEYVYRYSTNPDFDGATVVTTTEAGAFEIAGLEPGETYYFQTKAIGGGAYVDSDWSATISGTTAGVDLAPPSVSVEKAETNALSFVIGAVPNAQSYVYRYATSEEGLANAAWSEPVAAGTVELSNLAGGTTYYFQAYAVGDGKAYFDSAASAPVSAETLTIKLAAPAVSASAVDYSTLKFEIGYVANADSYIYEYSTSPDFTNATTGGTALRTVDVSGLNPYTTYYFRAKAVGTGAYETSEWSGTAEATTPKFDLAAPAIETVATSSSEIELTIGSVERATGYYCEYSTDPTFRSTNTLMATPGTFTLTGLSPNSKYYFRVLAYGGPTAKISAWSTDDATTLQAKLTPPTPTLEIVKGTDYYSSDKVRFAFDAVPNATKYVYRYSTDSKFASNVTTEETTSVGPFDFTDFKSGQTYYFQVMAVGDGDRYEDSDWSNVVSATTSAIDLPAPPVAVQTVGSTTLTFKIDAVAGADAYEYRYATSEEGLETAEVKRVSSSGTVELSGLDPVTKYYIQARAVGNGTNYITSVWSTPVDATTVKIALDAPQVGATAIDASTITFEIEEVANADAYVYEYSTSRYFTAETTTSGTATSAGSFDVSGLSPFTTYYFRAKAVVDAESRLAETHESSAWSTEASATTAKAALSAPAISAVALDTTTLALTIEPVANAAGYAYLMSTDPSFEGAEPVASGSGTIALTGLTPGQTYYFKAVSKADANDAYEDSAWPTTPIKATTPLAAPTISAQANGTTITLTLGAVEGDVARYVYEWSTNADFTGAQTVDAVAGTFAVEGWNADATYYFRAKAFGANSYVESEFSAVASTATVPNAPENVRFENFDFGGYTSSASLPASAFGEILWSDASNVEEYFLVQISTDNAEWSEVGRAEANATVLKATQLRQATTYYVRVCAGNAAGQSAWSYGEFTTPLAAPGEIKYGYYDGTKQTLEMYWKDNSDAEEEFVVEYRQDGSEWKEAGRTSANQDWRVAWRVFEDSVYKFRARAEKGDIVSDWSPETTIDPATSDVEEPLFSVETKPAAPTALMLGEYDEETGRLAMSWTDNSFNEDYFVVEYSVDGGSRWLEAARCGKNDNVDVLALTNLTADCLYRVYAVNAAGNSGYSNTVIVPATVFKPAAPTNFTLGAYNEEARTLAMSWTDNSSDEDYFVVEYSKNSSDWLVAERVAADVVSRVGWGVTVGADWSFRVYAVNAVGRSEYSNVVTLPATVFAPAAPTDLTFGAYNEATGLFEMSWTDNSFDEEYFVVEYSDNDSDWKVAGRVDKNDTSRLDYGIVVNPEWSYRVYAANAAGRSEYSNVVTIPATVFALSAPTNLTLGVYNEATRQLEMSWTDNSSDEEYFVVEYSKNGSAWKEGGRVGKNVESRVAWGVDPSAEWSFRVYAVSATGRSVYSNVVTISALSAPTNLTLGVYNEATRQLEMSWTDNSSDEEYFVVEYSKNGSAWSEGGRVGKNVESRVAWGVDPSAEWSFRVYAVSATGRSAYSNVEVFNSNKLTTDESSDVVSKAFADLFVEDVDDDFWFEFEKALGGRK